MISFFIRCTVDNLRNKTLEELIKEKKEYAGIQH
jgi:hypothetical protein